ncbi:MAG: GIY-YIG nuclease family protein [Chloroflexi bacterium]|nr:GIY-YIG nuclease family protein [Chloroflexota bacterium]
MTRSASATPWPPGDPGTYILLLRLTAPATIDVGRRGRYSMAAGWYAYAGSALGGLGPRLRRHLRAVKPRHWHIDALRELTDVVAVATHIGRDRLECATAAHIGRLDGAVIPAPRFGATDCRCPSHLFYFPICPHLGLGPSWTIHSLANTSAVDSAAGPK